MNITIRKMEAADLDRVIAIENASFSAPFSRSLFKKFLSHSAYHSFVAVHEGAIAGYIMYSFAADESDLVNIAVDAGFRRQGVAGRMLVRLFEHAKEAGIRSVFLEVRRSNRAARAFYKKHGFAEAGVRRGYYNDNGEDAITCVKAV